MELNDYAAKAMSFRLPSASALYALTNLTGEVGELMSLFAKAERDGPKPDFVDNVVKELGDILWHVTAIANDFGITLEEVGSINIEKLQSRSDRGKLQGSGDDR